jgi:TRAP-type C4-dicarboxylate transport system substrate-binding protein
MNKASYDNLPDDLQQVIDANSGMMASEWVGRVMDEGDIPGKQAAVDQGNTLITLDEAETGRWKEASQPVIDGWIAEMKDKGIDGAALYEDAKALIAKYADQ